MLTVRETAEHFRRAAFEFRFGLDREARLLAEAAALEAKAMIGQEHPEWPDLAASTIADKERQGFDVPAPLKRTGELQESIRGEAEITPAGARLVVGSSDPTAGFHETGTSKMPARPFLGPSLLRAKPAIQTAMGALIQRAITPGERP